MIDNQTILKKSGVQNPQKNGAILKSQTSREKLKIVAMKKMFTVFLFLAIGMFAFTQQNYQDVIYLKNGSIIRGIIIEQVPNVSLKIETANRSVFVYKMDEIEKMTKEPVLSAGKSLNSSSGRKSGYLGILNIGCGFGLGDVTKGLIVIKLDVINGYQFNPYFYLGFGTGLKVFTQDGITNLVLPLFLDFRGHLLDKEVSPYFGLGLGYTFLATPRFAALAFMIDPSIGARFKIGRKSAFNIGAGYFTLVGTGGAIGYINFDIGFSF